MEDKDCLYGIEQYLGLAGSAKATSGHLYSLGQAPPSSFQLNQLGFELEEESVDFSELVKACEQKDYVQTTNDYYSSGYWYQQEPPGTMTHNEEETSTPSGAGTTSNPQTNNSTPPSVAPAASPLPTVQDTGTRAQQRTKKKINDKSTHSDSCFKHTEDYKDKRQRNNIAVRKSRGKFRKRVLETEKRVEELEERNVKLKNHVALLQKELAVLKGLFSSAPNPNGTEQYL